MQRALSALLRDFGATARRVGDPGAQQRADSLWERIEPRLSNRVAILLSNARYIARRDHLKSIGGQDYAKVVGESIQHLESVVAAAVRRAEVVERRPCVVRPQRIVQLVSRQDRRATACG